MECCHLYNDMKHKNKTRRKMKWWRDDDKWEHKGIQFFEIEL